MCETTGCDITRGEGGRNGFHCNVIRQKRSTVVLEVHIGEIQKNRVVMDFVYNNFERKLDIHAGIHNAQQGTELTNRFSCSIQRRASVTSREDSNLFRVSAVSVPRGKKFGFWETRETLLRFVLTLEQVALVFLA